MLYIVCYVVLIFEGFMSDLVTLDISMQLVNTVCYILYVMWSLFLRVS